MALGYCPDAHGSVRPFLLLGILDKYDGKNVSSKFVQIRRRIGVSYRGL